MKTATHPVRSIALALGAALTLFAAAPAVADDFSRMGFYLGVGGSYVTDLYENQIEDAIPGVSVDVHPTPGVNARVGLRFLKLLGVELQYEWLDPYKIDLSFSGVSGSIKVKQQTLTANLKIYPLPVWRIQPYILAGVGFQHYDLSGNIGGGLFQASQKDDALAGRAGLGVDVYLTKHIVVYAEGSAVLTDAKFDVPSAVGNDIDNIFYAGGQVGMMWRF